MRCIDINGNNINVAPESIKLRVSPLAIIINDQKELLLLKIKSTGKYYLPGGGLNSNESLDECLKREILEETGLEAFDFKLFKVFDVFFHYNPLNETYQNISLIYTASVKNTNISLEHTLPNDGEAEEPGWVPLDNLKADRLQYPINSILDDILRLSVSR